MPKPKRYIVEWTEGGWALVNSKGKSIRRFVTQRQAIEAGSARASHSGGQLVIRRPDGSIQSHRAYGPDRSRSSE